MTARFFVPSFAVDSADGEYDVMSASNEKDVWSYGLGSRAVLGGARLNYPGNQGKLPSRV
jgi:hypothetical protein